ERLRRTDPGGAGGSAAADELLADLRLISASLEAHSGARVAAAELLDLQRRIEAFGFALGELEVRQHAMRHAAAVDELLGMAGTPGYLGMSETERLHVLEQQLEEDEPLALPGD